MPINYYTCNAMQMQLLHHTRFVTSQVLRLMCWRMLQVGFVLKRDEKEVYDTTLDHPLPSKRYTTKIDVHRRGLLNFVISR